MATPEEINADMLAFWNGKGGDTWVARQEHTDITLTPVTDALLAFAAPRAGERVVDIGCGCGAPTLEFARAVGPSGRVVGLDISEPMLAEGERRASAAGIANVDWRQADPAPAALEASFGALQETQRSGQWRWSREDLASALADLQRHGLTETKDGKYHLTPLGRLAGQGLCEVGSVVRLIDCLQPLSPQQICDPTLIAAVQTTVELNQVLFPINRKSTQKEPQAWSQELRQQGVPNSIFGNLQRDISEPHEGTLRAKKAVACLLYVTGRPMEEIERILTQFGGAFGGAAGPIRSVAARTCDLLPTAADIAEILHPGLDLADRVGRLIIRLDLGIAGPAVDLARHARTHLSRSDYARLLKAQLVSASTIQAAEDTAILACVDGDNGKLRVAREAAEAMAEVERRRAQRVTPMLEPYKA